MIDTHAHLLFFEDKDLIIQNMTQDNLSKIFNIATNINDSIESINYCQNKQNVFTTIGIHPEFANDYKNSDLEKLKELAQNNKSKVVAIGEIGLDYHYSDYDKHKQKELFTMQLKLASQLKLPVVIHCRDAVEDLYNILIQNKDLLNYGGIMHCYSEGSTWAKKFVELGFYISFSGNITYKKTEIEYIKNEIPTNRVLVETDCPFLTPVPFRGKTNYPKYIEYTLQKLSEIYNLPFDEMETITTNNALQIYLKN